jgi:DNA polymerase I
MIIERRISFEQFKDEPSREYLNCYTVSEDVVLQYRENEQKYSLRIQKYDWYFCVDTEDFQKHTVFKKLLAAGKIKRTEPDFNTTYTRIYCRNANRKVMDEKHEILLELDEKNIKHYEGDINSAWRCLIDFDLKISSNYKQLYYDIETDDRGKGIVVGRDSILSIACIDADLKVKYFSYKKDSKDGERNMLKKFLDYIDDYDILIGYNSEKFDLPYILERLRFHEIFFNPKQIIQLDLMQKIMELNKRNLDMIKTVRGFSLNAISQYVLNEQKVELTKGIYEMFETEPDLLKKYNIQDTMLLVKLDAKLKILKQKVIEHRITGNFLNEYAVSRLLDVYFLRKADSFNHIRFKTKPNRTQELFDEEDKYAGGYVKDPVLGLHKNVYHFDFTSLYPSIMQTFNISPETFIKKIETEEERTDQYIITPNHCLFSRSIGIIPILIEDLLKARNDIRNIEMKKYKEGTPQYEELYYKQYSFKTIANSFYGILGARFTRYYLLENAEAITLTGQYLSKLAMDWFKEEGHEPLYSDTDSVFAKINGEVDINLLYTRINQYLDYHLFKHFKILDSKINLKIEDKYDKFLLTDKKKYASSKDGKIKFKGIEARRRETLPITAKAQEELLHKVMLEDLSKEEVIDWLLKLKEKVYTSMTKEELTLQIRLSKDCDDYDKKIKDGDDNVVGVKESKLPHVKVAKWLQANNIKENGQNAWEETAYVKFIITEGFNGVDATSIYNYNNFYDRDYYWSVKVYAPLYRLLIVIFPEHDWLQYDIDEKALKKQRKLNAKQLQII